jgi:hypothetical protein
MSKIRVTYPIDPKHNHDCDGIHISGYEMEEVIMPATPREKAHKAIRIVLTGKNFKAVAQPLYVLVGKTPVQFVRISPDERSVEGILSQLPEEGSPVDVILGDQDHARHPQPFTKDRIRKIKE